MDIPLTRPDLQESDLAAMAEAVRAGAIARGTIASRFEALFARTIGAAGGVATNSGTSALVLALRVLDVGPGDEVVLPSYTCIALLHAIVQAGATPVLVDNECDPARMDFNTSARLVAKAISTRTRAILLPHMFGTAADAVAIRQLGIPVVEDITLSIGAETDAGRPVGSDGDITITSFHASKMLACGEGGMLLARNADLLERARLLNSWEDEQVEQRFEQALASYTLRYGFRMSDIHAACGMSQTDRLTAIIARRRLLAARYAEALQGIAGVTVPDATQGRCVFFRFIAFAPARNIVVTLRAFANAGIEAGRGVYPPLHHFLGLDKSDFPGAEQAIAGALSVPLYPALTEIEVTRILTASRAILDDASR